MKQPKPNHKWFLCIEAGGWLEEEEFVVEAKSLDEARTDASIWNASVIRELDDNEIIKEGYLNKE